MVMPLVAMARRSSQAYADRGDHDDEKGPRIDDERADDQPGEQQPHPDCCPRSQPGLREVAAAEHQERQGRPGRRSQ